MGSGKQRAFHVTSLPAWRDTLRAETYGGYFDFKQLGICAHVSIRNSLYKSYTIATPKHLEPFLPKNYIRIVAFTPNLHRAFFYSRIDFLPYSTTVKLLPLLILIIGSYSSLRISLRWMEVIASLVSAVARKFMQGCHPRSVPPTGAITNPG